jgi:hypothetical protein
MTREIRNGTGSKEMGMGIPSHLRHQGFLRYREAASCPSLAGCDFPRVPSLVMFPDLTVSCGGPTEY